jgi:AraC-like DNA-binding protein
MENEFGVTSVGPVLRRLSFDSVDRAEAELQLCGVEQQMRQLGSRSFQAKISSVYVNGLELISERYEAAISLSCGPPENSIAIIFTGTAEGQSRVNGRDVSDGGLVFLPLAGDLDCVFHGRFGSESIIIPEDRFNSIVASVCPESPFPRTASIVKINRGRTAGLRAEIAALLNQSMPNAEHVTDLVDATITYVSELQFRVPSSGPDSASYRRIAKQAQEFIEARFMGPIRIEDICRSCGVGVRTLQRAFRDYFGLTVTEYVKTTRLDKAFRALKAAVPAEATVADVAANNGFTHLGRFSVLYKERFRESPNSTLRSF